MNSISFKKLNEKNKRKILNIVSGNYPYENIDDSYKFFLKDLYENDLEYYIRYEKKSLVGMGYGINEEYIDLYWPFIKSNRKYLGQHKPPFFEISNQDIENFKKLYLEIMKPLNKKIFAYASDYGMEKQIKMILLEMGFKQEKVTQEMYWGEKYKNIIDVKNDSRNYKNMNESMKIIRQNPDEEIYLLSN